MRTWFRQMHPTVTFCFFLLVLLGTVFVPHPVTVTLSLLGALSYLLFSRAVKGRELLSYTVLFLIVSVSNPIFVHNGATLLFRIGSIRYTLEALLYGINTAVMLVAVLLWCRAFSATVGTERFLYVTGRFFPHTALVLAMAARQIPILFRRYRLASQCRLTSGAYVPRNKREALRGALHAFSAVIGEAMEMSVVTAASMRARGYNGGEASRRKKYRYVAQDVVSLCLLLLAFAGIVTLLALGEGQYSFYPHPDPVSLSGGSVWFYFLFFTLVFYPTFILWKGEWKWRSCISKI